MNNINQNSYLATFLLQAWTLYLTDFTSSIFTFRKSKWKRADKLVVVVLIYQAENEGNLHLMQTMIFQTIALKSIISFFHLLHMKDLINVYNFQCNPVSSNIFSIFGCVLLYPPYAWNTDWHIQQWKVSGSWSSRQKWNGFLYNWLTFPFGLFLHGGTMVYLFSLWENF